jgi:hypothetical protein
MSFWLSNKQNKVFIAGHCPWKRELLSHVSPARDRPPVETTSTQLSDLPIQNIGKTEKLIRGGYDYRSRSS